MPPAETVLLYPLSLAIFSVMAPTQKHNLFLSCSVTFKFRIALALVKIKALYFLASIGSSLAGLIFKVGMWLEDLKTETFTDVISSMMESRILGNDLNMGVARNIKKTSKPTKEGK